MNLLLIAVLVGTVTTISAYLLPEANSSKCISPEILNEMKDFLKLVPEAEIDVIIGEHYLVDGSFRHAANYLKSSKFPDLLDKIQDVPEVVALLDFLHVIEDCNRFDLDIPYMEIVLLEAMENEQRLKHRSRRATVEQPYENLNSLINVVREILGHLPRDKYNQLIKTKLAKNGKFTDLYKAVRSTDFKTKLDSTVNCKNMAPYISELNSNAIDTKSLQQIAYEVISWGPSP